MEPIHQQYKAKENTSRHNPKKKQKQTINKNPIKTLCHSYDILGARMLWKPKEARIKKKIIEF
jgi:hypothetical protein